MGSQKCTKDIITAIYKKKKSKWPIYIKKYYISLPIEKHADLKCDTVSHIHLIG